MQRDKTKVKRFQIRDVTNCDTSARARVSESVTFKTPESFLSTKRISNSYLK